MRIRRWWLPAFFLAFYLLPLDWRPLWSPDESRYAEISREMIQSGDWVVPHFLGLRYFEKPIGGYWLNSLSQLAFGDTNFAVRLASALATAGSTLLVIGFAWHLWRCRQTALVSGLLYLSTVLVIGIGTYSVLDAMITLSLNAAMVCFYLARSANTTAQRALRYLLFGLVCGIGFLLKGFIALAIPVLVLVPFALAQRQFRTLLGYGLLAVLAAVLLVAPWALAVHQREPDYWHYFFWVEHIQRFGADNAQHKSPFWFYLPVLLIATLPWSGFLPGALKSALQQCRQRADLLYLLLWFVLPFLFFSIAKGKLVTYILPCMAPLILLLARYLVDQYRSGQWRSLKANARVNLIFGLLGVGALLVFWFAPSSSVYTASEHGPLAVAIAIFTGWALLGGLALRDVSRRWLLPALAPVLLCTGLSWALPGSVLDDQLPQSFLRQQQDKLADARYLATNDLALASTLALQTRRHDITLFERRGEVEYGLAYPDAAGRYVERAEMPAWIARTRQQGTVAVLVFGRPAEEHRDLPVADQRIQRHRLTLLIYHPVPSARSIPPAKAP